MNNDIIRSMFNEIDEKSQVVIGFKADISDQNLNEKLKKLECSLSQAVSDSFHRVAVQPWNSVKVTFRTKKEAVERLRMLCRESGSKLHDLGILTVQVENEDVIDLRNIHLEHFIQPQVVAGESSGMIQINSGGIPMQKCAMTVQRKRPRKKSKDSGKILPNAKLAKKQNDILFSMQPGGFSKQVVDPGQMSVMSLGSNPSSIMSADVDPGQFFNGSEFQDINTEDDLMSVQLQSLNSGQNLPQTPSQDDVFNQRFSQDQFDFDINSATVGANGSKINIHDQPKPFKTPGQPQNSHQFVGQTTQGMQQQVYMNPENIQQNHSQQVHQANKLALLQRQQPQLPWQQQNTNKVINVSSKNTNFILSQFQTANNVQSQPQQFNMKSTQQNQHQAPLLVDLLSNGEQQSSQIHAQSPLSGIQQQAQQTAKPKKKRPSKKRSHQ